MELTTTLWLLDMIKTLKSALQKGTIKWSEYDEYSPRDCLIYDDKNVYSHDDYREYKIVLNSCLAEHLITDTYEDYVKSSCVKSVRYVLNEDSEYVEIIIKDKAGTANVIIEKDDVYLV